VRAELTSRLGRMPTDGELAAELGVDSDDLVRLEEAGQAQALAEEPDSLPARPENGGQDLDLSDERLQLAGAFRALDPAEQKILYLRFVKDLSRKETADELGISEGQLSRRTQAALGKLRGELEGAGSGRAAPARAPVKKQEREFSSEPPGQGKPKDGHSGRLLLRMPQSLHAELANAAEREEVSLNQFITNTLAAAMSWQQAEGHEDGGAFGPRPPTPRWLPAAIVTNIVVVVVAGVVAVILLLVAWQQGW